MLKKFLQSWVMLLLATSAVAQTYPSPTFEDVTVQSDLFLPSKPANSFFVAPDGLAGVPSFRTMVSGDVPSLDASKITTGTLPVLRGGTGTTTSTGSGSVVLNTSPSFATDLTINGAAGSNRNVRFTTANALRWQIIGNNNAEAGANAGTNFAIARYDDAGAFLSQPFWITRSSGNVGINTTGPTATLDVNGTSKAAGFQVDGAAASLRDINMATASSNRWTIRTDNAGESGGNAGSNFALIRRDDAGASLGNVLSITRSSGAATFANNLTVGGNSAVTGSHTVTGNLIANGNATINFSTPSAANTTFNGAGMEMFWTGGPFIDFKNDSATDFDVRMQLVDDDTLEFQGNHIVNGNSTVIANIVNDALPNLSKSVQGTGVPGLDGGHWMIWNNQTGPTFDPVPTLRIDRNASPSVVAGTPANTYQAVKINGTAGVNNQGYEWPLTVEMHNYSLASLNAENVAINGTAWLENNGVGETGKTWAANFNVSDKTTTVNPTKGRVALELDTYADPAGSTDNNRARVGLQIAVGTHNGVAPSAGTPLHIGRGFLVGANQANVIMDRLMEVSGLGTYDIGIDTTAATFTKPVLFMKEAQRIALDGNTSGAYARSLRYDAGQFVYNSQNGNVVQISDDGLISAGYTGSAGVRLSLANSAGTCTLTPTATTASFVCSSDERLKDNIVDVGDVSDWVNAFRVREYNIKSTGEKVVGVIAQETQKTHPEMVKPQADGMLSVEAPNPWMLVKALQEQQKEIDLLKIWLAGLSGLVLLLMVLVAFRGRKA